MSEDLIQELRQGGHLDSEGVFTSADPRAVLELSRRFLAKPELYLLKAVQACVAGGAEQLVFGRRILEVRGKEPAPLELSPLNWISQAFLPSATPAQRHCAVALLGAWSDCKEIELNWGPIHWRLRPDLGPEPEALSPFRSPPFFRFKPRGFQLSLGPGSGRLYACPVPVQVGSGFAQPLAFTQALDSDPSQWWNGGFWAAMGTGTGPILVPELATSPVFFEPEITGPPGMGNIRWQKVRRLYCLSRSSRESGCVIPVEAGVALDALEVDLGVAGLRCLVSLELEGLRTDLGQFRVVQNAEWFKLVESLRQEAPARVAEMTGRLDQWRAPLTFENGTLTAGLVGLTGGVLAGTGLSLLTGATGGLCLLGLPIGAGLAAWAAKRWHSKALQHMRSLRSEGPDAG
jgi:hypothetical protein